MVRRAPLLHPFKTPVPSTFEDGLELYLPLQFEKAYDFSGKERHGTYAGSPSLEPATGSRGSALEINGIDEWIVLDGLGLDLTGTAVTLSAWCCLSDMTNDGGVISKRTRYEIYFETDDNTWRAAVHADSVVVAIGLTAEVDTWTHVAMVYDGAFLTCYVNGIAGTPVAVVGNIQSNGEVSVGVRFRPTSVFNGQVAHARIYSRALAASELQRQYALGM